MSTPEDDTSHSAEAAPARRRRHRRATRQGIEQPAGDERAWEDDDRAWGDTPENREERLRRDVPPHWS